MTLLSCVFGLVRDKVGFIPIFLLLLKGALA